MNICKDAGYAAVGNQIELFAKLSILVLSISDFDGFFRDSRELFMKKWGVCVICILLLCVIETVPVFASEKNTQDYLGNMTEELDFSKLDHFMRQDAEDSGITFSELVKELLYQEKPGALYQQIGPWLMGQLCESVCENRKILVEVVLLAVCFSVLKNFAGAFASSYVSDLCFILVFCVLAVLMLQSFLTFREIVCGVLEKSVDFFQIFMPTFSIAMLFSAGESIASGFYQTAFLIIYLIEWLFLTILVPMIHIYILTVLINYFFEEEKFAKHDGIDWRTDRGGQSDLPESLYLG